jgi:L-aminopeptidase/D-esterase-like protein
VTNIAQMAHDGVARAIAPAHTPVDGDTIVALATDVMAAAIVRAAREATGIPGYPAARDMP